MPEFESFEEAQAAEESALQGMRARQKSPTKARSDLVMGGIVAALIILFIGNASRAFINVAVHHIDTNLGNERVITVAVLLNVALILFGWRRYNELQHEVKQRTIAEQRAHRLAITDALTGFLNRRALVETTSMMIEKARKRRMAVAFIIIDMDDFKRVNDLYGHDVGDQLLKKFATRMEAITPANALRARLGGDEFGFAVTFDPSHPSPVSRLAEDCIEAASKSFIIAENVLEISITVGLSRSDFSEDSVETMMRRADIAMYEAKRAGKNAYKWFSEDMEVEMRSRSEMEAAIKLGIRNGEFVPYFEQQVHLETGALRGFEMLARWESPTLGLVTPDEFITVAEDKRLIGELSESVMRQAFEEARNWDPALTLSVNISPVQLLDPWMAQRILKLLMQTGFPASRLEVEITESSLFDNLSLAQSIIGSLKNQGIRIALDDFGTGYSSLAHLRALPFDMIKIDRSFVSEIARDGDAAAIVKAIYSLADSLSLPIIAEGIEDELVRDHLLRIGPCTAQGWHYGKPLSIEQTRSLLAENGLLPSARAESEPVADGPIAPLPQIEPTAATI